MLRFLGLLNAVLVVSFCGCGGREAPAERPPAPRPVTVLILKQTEPVSLNQQAGAVSSWKTEQLGFQVGGRVQSVLEPGTEVLGHTVDELNREISAGSVIATLETERYDLQLAAAKARHQTTISQKQAKQTELDLVVPARIKSAKAAYTLSKEDYVRVEQLYERKVSTKADLERAEAARDTAEADVNQAEATQAITTAELASLEAETNQAMEAVKSAQKDLDDTKLISAYHGQIAEVHQIPGGVVKAGEAVVTVQMMNPIMVDVAVSAETDARLNYNDVVRVYLSNQTEPIEAMVYEKAAVADAETRTFEVTLLVRNEQIEVGLPQGKASEDVVRIRSLWRLYSESLDRKPPFFVNVQALRKDDEGDFVWKVANRQMNSVRETAATELKLEKVRVTPGEKRIPFLQVAIFRELTDLGNLDPETDLVAGQFFDSDDRPVDVPGTVSDDGTEASVAYIRKRWRLRPGELVRVDLAAKPTPRGFYLPTDVIRAQAGKHSVFVVESEKVKQVPVNVFEDAGTLRRVEPVESGALSEGDQVVSQGALFLNDGEKVNVVEVIEAPQ